MMLNTLYKAAVFAIFIAGMAAAANAQTDPRMMVRVDFEEGKQLSLKNAIQKALPTLWDRVVVRSARSSVPADAKATSLLMRAIPDADGVSVEFHPSRTFEYLKQNSIEYIEQQPRMQLIIHLWNQNGVEMMQSSQLLQQEAESIAQQWGIGLEEGAPVLVLNWRWLDATTVNLMTRGNAYLPESSETRDFRQGDPLEQLRIWMADRLVAARDAEVTARASQLAGSETAMAGKVRTANGIEAILMVERPATLAEQVILEEALEKHPAVAAVVPKYLSHDSRQYMLYLKGSDDAWVPAWFKKRGMLVSPTPQGWLVR